MDIIAKIEQGLYDLGLNVRPINNLYEPIAYTLENGGKRIRPTLCLMAANLHQQNTDQALAAALALEIFHNFTLLHDDLMDKSPLRRGKLSVYKKWDESTAILSGDAMMILSYRQLENLPPLLLAKIFPIFSKTAIEVCEGQQLDMDLEHMDLSNEDDFESLVSIYEEMIRLKTAVLIATSLKIGAIIGGESDDVANRFYTIGEEIGMAFQYQDDTLDVYADDRIFKKQLGGDILVGKKTFLLLRALKDANQDQKKRLLKAIQRPESDGKDKIKAVKAIYAELNIKEKMQEAIDQRISRAKLLLNSLPFPQEALTPLHQLIFQLSIRQS